MEYQGETSVVFDYTAFLGEAYSKKWTFLEAVGSIAPIFGIAWHQTVQQELTLEERLKLKAMKLLSASRSDESNIRALLKLAKTEGIRELRLVMPYELEKDQLERIQKRAQVSITNLEQDELMIIL